jgi:hypothetical protein
VQRIRYAENETNYRPAVRPPASSWPTVRSRGCCARTGRGASRTYDRPYGRRQHGPCGPASPGGTSAEEHSRGRLCHTSGRGRPLHVVLPSGRARPYAGRMFARRSRPLTHVMLLVGVLLRTVPAAVTPATWPMATTSS